MASDALGNIGYVRRLWQAFESGGVPEMAELIPSDVTWRPLEACGRSVHGTDDLNAFWSSREVEMPTIRMFHRNGDDVLVEAEYRPEDGGSRTVWLLYRFRGERLLEAIGFRTEAQARSYSPPPAPG